MKVFCSGFWSGFHEKTNGVNERFFQLLFEQVYKEPVSFTSNFEEAEILLENTQAQPSLLHSRRWKHTYLFSGESYCKSNGHEYTCVLSGQRSHENVVNCPLWIPYLVSSFDSTLRPHFDLDRPIPEKDILVCISNPSGTMRKDFCDALDTSGFSVTYAGHYKNNLPNGPFQPYMTSDAFLELCGQHKFVLSMENSQSDLSAIPARRDQDTYITEKILHPLLSGSIPIYWGSQRVTDYFHSERFLLVKNKEDIEPVLQKMKTICQNPSLWTSMVNQPTLTQFGKDYTVSEIARQIRGLLARPFTPFPQISQIYFLCNPAFEKERYDSILAMCKRDKIPLDCVSFLSPTYKTTLTEDDMKNHVKNQVVQMLRVQPMKKGEVSLYLNYKAALEDIEKRYRGGMFFVFESDTYWKEACGEAIHPLLSLLQQHQKSWHLFHLGGKGEISKDVCHPGVCPWLRVDYDFLRKCAQDDSLVKLAPEGCTLMRKFHTRCTDSLLFSYDGVCKMVEYLHTKTNYGVPFDYYVCEKLMSDTTFTHYWCWPTYFDQSSHGGSSTIQNDRT